MNQPLPAFGCEPKKAATAAQETRPWRWCSSCLKMLKSAGGESGASESWSWSLTTSSSRMESRLSINQTGTPLERHTPDLTITRQRSHKSLIVGYSTVSEAITQTGPDHHEGNGGVSVKPPLPVSPAAQPRACQEFLVTFVSQTKVTRPSACAASGAKQCLADFAQQNRAFDFTNLGGQPKQTILCSKRGEMVFSGFCVAKPCF